ncbi:TolC family protein [Marinilabiliaceae bacterium ANBcel2]|nr:TolC family protein [Marinilabiliaceae bacterium ANBcel2]
MNVVGLKYYCTLLLIIFLISISVNGGNNLSLSLKEAEERFLEKNIVLMAEKLEMDIKELKIREAKRWNNPEFEVEHQIINRDESGPVGFTGSDNTAFEIEQLFSTAGKRGHNIKLRELDRLKSEAQLNKLIRTLTKTLREEYVTLAYLNRIKGLYQKQIDALEKILEGFESQYKEGNIRRLEIVRFRSLLLELEKEYSVVLKKKMESQQSLKVLLQLEDKTPVPKLPEDPWQYTEKPQYLNLNNFYQTALESRGDIRSSVINVNSAERELKLEEANQWPDLTIGMAYDKLDGVIDNYFGITLSMELPLWNRNRENVRIASHRIKQSQLILNQKEQKLKLEIESALNKLNRAKRLYKRTEFFYEAEFEEIIKALTIQYKRGDIRLIEFVDFYESFRESVIRKYSVQQELLIAAEELNFEVGRDIFQFNF